MRLTNNLKVFRTARGASLADVAEAVGIDRSHLWRVEQGKGGCSDETKLALARYYGVSVTALFFVESVAVNATGGSEVGR